MIAQLGLRFRFKRFIAFAVAASVCSMLFSGDAKMQTRSHPRRVLPSGNTQAKPPISKEKLVKALRFTQQDGLLRRSLLQDVRVRGVDFAATSTDEADIRAAGADQELIAAVRAGYHRPANGTPTTTGAVTAITGRPQPSRLEPVVPAKREPAPLLAGDTPVRLRLNRTISSGTEKVGDKVDFVVIEPVRIGNVVVIPQGASAIATVTEAKKKGRFGKSGKLNISIEHLQHASNGKIPLRAVKGGSGGGRKGLMTGAMIATGIVFFPAAPLFLFMKGKDITIEKGTEITAYVAADTRIEPVQR